MSRMPEIDARLQAFNLRWPFHSTLTACIEGTRSFAQITAKKEQGTVTRKEANKAEKAGLAVIVSRYFGDVLEATEAGEDYYDAAEEDFTKYV